MMSDSDIILITAQDVISALDSREGTVVDVVRKAYEIHACGDFVLPHSVFLRLPGNNGDRIIALPAQLGGESPILGMKWISSFPKNINRGLDRASAVIVLNDADTGRPRAILEGSAISAVRTAASAALASKAMSGMGAVACCGIVGCGRINFEIVRFLQSVQSGLSSLILYDTAPGRAESFTAKCKRTWPNLAVTISNSIADLASNTRLISFATTAATPHVADVSIFLPGSLILHISLRDLAPQVVLACDNVVDDVDHVCREDTSVHLAEKCIRTKGFIRCTLGEILTGRAKARVANDGVVVFSPFGLGLLDLAVAAFVLDRVSATGGGYAVPSFLPTPWATD